MARSSFEEFPRDGLGVEPGAIPDPSETPLPRVDATTISVELARRLHAAGLGWQPANGDQFFIPDRDLDDRVFSISDMSVDVQTAPGGRLIAFNGAVEWALDAIMQQEVIWLPSETQLRELLGDRFVSLQRTEDRYRCEVVIGGERTCFEDANAPQAYGLALLRWLQTQPRPIPQA